MKKTLPSLRVETEDTKNIEAAIKKFNKNSVLEMSMQGFRRLAYKILAQMILSGDKIPISFKS